MAQKINNIKSKQTERRKHVRIPARFAVLMKLDNEQFPEYTMEAEVLNISENGVLLSLPDERGVRESDENMNASFFYGDLKFESLMSWLQFVLPTHDTPLRILGKPTWIMRPEEKTKQCLIAMQFTHISPEDRKKLSFYIHHSSTTTS